MVQAKNFPIYFFARFRSPSGFEFQCMLHSIERIMLTSVMKRFLGGNKVQHQ